MSDYVKRVSQLATPLRPALSHIDIEMTERCDNDCIHCCINLSAGDAAARAREMTTDQVKDILLQAADLGCLQVRLTGGEPLLRTDFDEVYLFARRLGLKVLVFTNARGVTSRLAGLLERVPPLVPIEVTVYGMRRESYEAVSGVPGSFSQFLRGVRLLRDHGIPFVVKSVVLPPNRAEMEDFESWARTIPWMDGPPEYSLFLTLRDRRDNPAKNRVIQGLRLSPEEGLALMARYDTKYRQQAMEFASRFMGPPGDALFRCRSGHEISIDAYGYAQACLQFRAPELAVDTSTRTLSAAVAQLAALRGMRATNPDYLSRCAVCFLHGLCEQCPARSWAEHGTLDTPVEYFCTVAHAQGRYLGWLAEDENAWEVADWQRRVFPAGAPQPLKRMEGVG
jgi:radical SAM protein with 4Fe4S-binding SPASM domain